MNSWIHESITWFSCTLISHEFMNSWKHESILLYFYFTYITQYHIDSTSVASKLSEEEDLEISTWQDYRTSLELVTEITVQIQDKHHLIFMYLDKSWIHESITWFSCTLISHEFMNSWIHENMKVVGTSAW